jgi:3-dehydroquinate dehydratase-1
LGSPRICLSVAAYTTEHVLKAIRSNSPDLYEVRLDYRTCPIDLEEVRAATDAPLIATNRGTQSWGDEKDRVALLLEASRVGFDYVDLEAESMTLPKASEEIHENGSGLIVSHHDNEATPSHAAMKRLQDVSKRVGGDICKIVGAARSYMDNLVYLQFQADNPGNICFGMGEHGVLSRVMCPLLGGAFTYASTATGQECAPGQLTLDQMREIYRLMEVHN